MITKQPTADTELVATSAWRFPVDVLTERAEWRSLWARAVLVSLPFQYVTLTHVPGGIERGDYGGVVLAVLLYLLCVWLMSLLLAIWGESGRYQERVRRRAFALVVIWTLAELLLAMSLAYSIWRSNVTQDIVGGWLCGKEKWPWRPPCTVDYPGLNWQTLVTYTIYSLLAAALATAITKLASRQTKNAERTGSVAETGQETDAAATQQHEAQEKPASAPFLATIVLATALLMTLVHSATALYGFRVRALQSGWLADVGPNRSNNSRAHAYVNLTPKTTNLLLSAFDPSSTDPSNNRRGF